MRVEILKIETGEKIRATVYKTKTVFTFFSQWFGVRTSFVLSCQGDHSGLEDECLVELFKEGRDGFDYLCYEGKQRVGLEFSSCWKITDMGHRVY